MRGKREGGVEERTMRGWFFSSRTKGMNEVPSPGGVGYNRKNNASVTIVTLISRGDYLDGIATEQSWDRTRTEQICGVYRGEGRRMLSASVLVA